MAYQLKNCNFSLKFLLLGCGLLVQAQLFSAKECGRRAENLDVGIYYGQQARQNEFPWQISLRFQGEHSCGGTIISDNWIITAAHCVVEDNGFHDPARVFKVLIGSLDSVPSTITREMEYIDVKQVVAHPQYNTQSVNAYTPNDIALLELSQPIGLNHTGNNINAICLGRPEDVIPGREVVISGWGETESEKFPRMLRRANVVVESMEKCKQTSQPNTIWEGQVCTTSRPDTCEGDSGGPLQYSDKEGRWYLMGLTSWGPKNCGNGLEPGVYTRVAYYLDFIKQVTGITPV